MLRGCGFINGDVFMHPSAYVGPGDPAAWFASLQVGDEVEFVAKFHVEGRNNWRVVRVRDVPDAMMIQRRRRVLASSCADIYENPAAYPRTPVYANRWAARHNSAPPPLQSTRSPHRMFAQPAARPVSQPQGEPFNLPEWDQSVLDMELRMAVGNPLLQPAEQPEMLLQPPPRSSTETTSSSSTGSTSSPFQSDAGVLDLPLSAYQFGLDDPVPLPFSTQGPSHVLPELTEDMLKQPQGQDSHQEHDISTSFQGLSFLDAL
jgi:hypothetical protein